MVSTPTLLLGDSFRNLSAVRVRPCPGVELSRGFYWPKAAVWPVVSFGCWLTCTEPASYPSADYTRSRAGNRSLDP
jgi:hypothetical protein